MDIVQLQLMVVLLLLVAIAPLQAGWQDSLDKLQLYSIF